MLKVGDAVRIVRSGQCFDRYDNWIADNCPEYAHLWKSGAIPEEGTIGVVKCAALRTPHPESTTIYGVLTYKGFFIISEEGLKLIKEYEGGSNMLKIGDKVIVAKPGKYYASYDKWVDMYADEYKETWIKSGPGPSNGDTGTVVAKGFHENDHNGLLIMEIISGQLRSMTFPIPSVHTVEPSWTNHGMPRTSIPIGKEEHEIRRFSCGSTNQASGSV